MLQRDIVQVYGASLLADHPLGATIAQRMAALRPRRPQPAAAGLIAWPVGAWSSVVTGAVRGGADKVALALDAPDRGGALAHLVLDGVQWAGVGSSTGSGSSGSAGRAGVTGGLGALVYKTYNDSDVRAQTQVKIDGFNCCCCYGWEGMQAIAQPRQNTVLARVTDVFASAPPGAPALAAPFTLLVRSVFDASLVSEYGAPTEVR